MSNDCITARNTHKFNINRRIADITGDHRRQDVVLDSTRRWLRHNSFRPLTSTRAATVAIIPNDFISVEFQPGRKCPS